MYKFKVGDKVIGIGAMYGHEEDPFYGEVIKQKWYDVKYYEIKGTYPIKNKLSEDGTQSIFATEQNLQEYNEKVCKMIFFRASRIKILKDEIKKLKNEMQEILEDKFEE